MQVIPSKWRTSFHSADMVHDFRLLIKCPSCKDRSFFLNDPLTLRMQPPLNVDRTDIDFFSVKHLIVYARSYVKKDFYLLYRYTVGDCRKPVEVNDYRDRNLPILSSMVDETSQLVGSFAFLCHYPSTNDLIKKIHLRLNSLVKKS